MAYHSGQSPIAATIEQAPAKINLGLHVTGQRQDGFHLLDMLVAFTKFGDTIHIRPSRDDGFSIEGPMSAGLEHDSASNLVVRARDILRQHLEANHALTTKVHIMLYKRLPTASGIGGGSADAAATLRALLRHWDVTMSQSQLEALGLHLGADVPMCLASKSLIAKGIGEQLQHVAHMPKLAMVLVNPLKTVSTPQIFKQLASKTNAPMPTFDDSQATDWRDVLSRLRNDLETPAKAQLGEIDAALAALSTEGAWLSRMSGSGATCYGLFDHLEQASTASHQLREQFPNWFIQETETI